MEVSTKIGPQITTTISPVRIDKYLLFSHYIILFCQNSKEPTRSVFSHQTWNFYTFSPIVCDNFILQRLDRHSPFRNFFSLSIIDRFFLLDTAAASLQTEKTYAKKSSGQWDCCINLVLSDSSSYCFQYLPNWFTAAFSFHLSESPNATFFPLKIRFLVHQPGYTCPGLHNICFVGHLALWGPSQQS